MILIKMVLMLIILIKIAFITLFERKILGLSQNRKGPNKSYYLGLFQPFSDALKLIFKEINLLIYINSFMYLLMPLFSTFLMLIIWTIFPFCWSENNSYLYSLLMVMLISSLSVYVILFSGWSSNSKYALLGSFRGIAQTISYEVSMSFIIINIAMMSSYLINKIMILQQNSMPNFFGLNLMMIIWIIIILAEMNRTPMDLSESESELVSGFNIEFGGVLFTLLFMAEYGNILFFSMLTSILFLENSYFFLNYLMVVWVIIISRSTFVRYRYDKLMMLAWKVILPFSILCLMTSYMML